MQSPRAGSSLMHCYIQYLTDVKLFLHSHRRKQQVHSGKLYQNSVSFLLYQQEHLSNSLLTWLYSTLTLSWPIENLSLFTSSTYSENKQLLKECTETKPELKSALLHKQCVICLHNERIQRLHRQKLPVRKVHVWGDVLWSEEFCTDLACGVTQLEFHRLAINCDNRCRKKIKSKSETTICLVGLPSSLPYTGMGTD